MCLHSVIIIGDFSNTLFCFQIFDIVAIGDAFTLLFSCIYTGCILESYWPTFVVICWVSIELSFLIYLIFVVSHRLTAQSFCNEYKGCGFSFTFIFLHSSSLTDWKFLICFHYGMACSICRQEASS